MKKYERPDAVVVEGVSEGVYATSGTTASASGCYTATAYIHQTPEDGRQDFRIQADAKHDTDHVSEAQRLVISFNVPVNYVSSQGSLFSGDGTNQITISYNYHNNGKDNIGLGDVCVTRVDGGKSGLEITNVAMLCAGAHDF